MAGFLALVPRSAARLSLIALVVGACSVVLAAEPPLQSVTCGGIEYSIKPQREKGNLPGLSIPRIYFDRRGTGKANSTYLRWTGKNDVYSSPFAVTAGQQFHPVAEQMGIYCQDDDRPAIIARILEWGDIEGSDRSQMFADYVSDDVITIDPEYRTGPGDGEWIPAGYAVFSPGTDGRNSKKTVLTASEVFDFDVVVDPALDVRLPEVEGFNDGDPVRPTGRAQFGDLGSADYVLDELTVFVPDDATLDGILTRWNAQLVDRSPLDRQGRSTALIRFDPAVLAMVDTSDLAENLLLLEGGHRGTLSVSSDRLAQLFAVAAKEALEQGSIVAPNILLQSDSITTGTTDEGLLQTDPNDPNAVTPLDAFAFSFIRDDVNSMRTSVGRAWQVMDATVGFGEKVSVMIVDGGFIANDDFPNDVTLRQTEWGTPSPLPNSSGGQSPWHGTASTTSAAGLVDNDFGTAGPAGPIAKMVLVGLFKDEYKTLRRARDMVDEYRPAVVNMSFSASHYAFRKATEVLKDIYFEEMNDYGALLFASAGNKGIDVDQKISGDETPTILPCESKYVVCVGGMNGDGTHSGGANYGTVTGNKTAEIHGPMCTYGKVDDEDFFNVNMKNVCGTSESSPFVAGVAALVKSANPSLSNYELRDLLYETAHVGAPFVLPVGGGYTRTINALDAVVAALGIELSPPTLSIQNPTNNSQVSKASSVDLRAVASDTFERPLKISWTSDIDGYLTTTSSGIFGAVALSAGTHTITARATDFRGVYKEKSVQVQVGFKPTVQIVSPKATTKIYQGNNVSFTAKSYDPDTYGPVADSGIQWNVTRNGVDIWAGIGHIANAPANLFTPGTYDLFVSATDAEGYGTASGKFTITAVPPGQNPPSATIVTPASTLSLKSLEGAPLNVQFLGTGFDLQDGALSGYKFRWTALSDQGTKKTLCTGSQVAQNGNGGLVVPKSCQSFTAALAPDNGAVDTTWVVTLEVFDSSGLVGTAERVIKINWQTL